LVFVEKAYIKLHKADKPDLIFDLCDANSLVAKEGAEVILPRPMQNLAHRVTWRVRAWDEWSSTLDNALRHHLRTLPPFRALRESFVETLGGRYTADLKFQPERVSYIYATKQLHAAALKTDLANRHALKDGIEKTLSRKHRPAAAIIAGAALLALDIAVEQWQAARGKKHLGELIAGAFDQMESLGSIE